ncbi:hypothetical protein GCM10023237_26550 [Streptomyces coeruleoprunus]
MVAAATPATATGTAYRAALPRTGRSVCALSFGAMSELPPWCGGINLTKPAPTGASVHGINSAYLSGMTRHQGLPDAACHPAR